MGWADSTQSGPDTGVSTVGGQSHSASLATGISGAAGAGAKAPNFAVRGSSGTAGGNDNRGTAVGSGIGERGGRVACATPAFRENISRMKSALSAATAAAGAVGATGAPLGAIGSARKLGGFHQNITFRSARGGTSWTVPGGSGGGGGSCGRGDDGHGLTSGGVSGAGSAEVWPASSSHSGCAFPDDCGVGGGENGDVGGGGGVGGIAEAVAAAARQRNQRVAESGSTPSATVGRPSGDLGGLWSTSRASPADVDMLAEMGFDRGQAADALRICHGSVDRAAEYLLSASETLDTGAGSGGGEVTYGPHLQPAAFEHAGIDDGVGWQGGGKLQTAVGQEASGGSLTVDVNDDLITNADAADVGQGLDMEEFWSAAAKGTSDSVGPTAAGGADWMISGGGCFEGQEQEAHKLQESEEKDEDIDHDLVMR